MGWMQATFQNFEVILVDDGGSDAGPTEKLALQNGCIYIRLPQNQGKGGALRKGFERALGKVSSNRCILNAHPLMAVAHFYICIVFDAGKGWVDNIIVNNILRVLWPHLCVPFHRSRHTQAEKNSFHGIKIMVLQIQSLFLNVKQAIKLAFS